MDKSDGPAAAAARYRAALAEIEGYATMYRAPAPRPAPAPGLPWAAILGAVALLVVVVALVCATLQ